MFGIIRHVGELPPVPHVLIKSDRHDHTAMRIHNPPPARHCAASFDAVTGHDVSPWNPHAVLQIEDNMEGGSGIGEFLRLAVQPHLADAVHEDGPFTIIMKVIDHQKSAAAEILANPSGLRAGQLPVPDRYGK